MKNFYLPCVSCKNQLSECGSLLNSPTLGPLVACEICRALYFVEIVKQMDAETTMIMLKPVKLDPESEYDIIRYAESRIPLKDCLTFPGQNKPKSQEETSTLKEIISSCTTPSDLIRKLHVD